MSSEAISDELRGYLQQAQKPSLKTCEDDLYGQYNFHDFHREEAQHLTKQFRIPLFIGLSDGEVFLHHLTTHLTSAPTIHASYALLQRWEASPPTHCVNVGGHASQRDTCRRYRLSSRGFCDFSVTFSPSFRPAEFEIRLL